MLAGAVADAAKQLLVHDRVLADERVLAHVRGGGYCLEVARLLSPI